MSKIVYYFKYAFNNYPIATNSLIYGTLFVGAEFSQQTLSKKILAKKPESYDTATIGRYAFYGTSVQGPLLSIWYKWLDAKFMGKSYQIIMKKLLLDQFLFTPQLLIIFYVAMSILERKENLFEECQQKLLPTFKTSCMFWLPAQAVNFILIPSAFRVAYVGTCSFAWVNILCCIKRKEY